MIMTLYDSSVAPSPRRVRIFIAEKGIDIPRVEVDLRRGEHLEAAFRAKSPRCTVPVLELEDGTCLWETLAICDYLEALYPEPRLIGRDPLERARILMWNARIEQDGFLAAAEALRNAVPGMAGRAITGSESFEQIPALAERGRRRVDLFMRDLDGHLAASRYVVGDGFTMADISALVVVDFASRVVKGAADGREHLGRWHAEVSARPSAKA